MDSIIPSFFDIDYSHNVIVVGESDGFVNKWQGELASKDSFRWIELGEKEAQEYEIISKESDNPLESLAQKKGWNNYNISFEDRQLVKDIFHINTITLWDENFLSVLLSESTPRNAVVILETTEFTSLSIEIINTIRANVACFIYNKLTESDDLYFQKYDPGYISQSYT